MQEQINEKRHQVELETQEAQANLRQLRYSFHFYYFIAFPPLTKSYRQQQEREEPILKQLRDEIDAHAATISQANSRQAQLNSELSDLKTQAHEKMGKIVRRKG